MGPNTPPYNEGSRGLKYRWPSPNGTGGTDESQWQYQNGGGLISVTAPNGTRSETYLYNLYNINAMNFGYEDARNGLAYEERVYAPGQNGALLRRTLTDYAQNT